MTPVALTIAGSDPSGGAGIQADLKTFHQFGVYGMSVITLLTVQNTTGVSSVDPLDAAYVEQQLDAVLEDIPPQAAKTGALGSREIIEVVARRAARFAFPLVVDPVMVSKHGAALLAGEAQVTLAKELLPRAFLVTPNLTEAAAFAGIDVADVAAMEEAARRIAELGPRAVLIKGGHLAADPTDILYCEGRLERFPGRRIDSRHTHGTGCTYSAAITAGLAKGLPLVEAIRSAKHFITNAIASAPGLGRGCGPVNHHAEPTDGSPSTS
jgi:hydroxymethylpyrimidine/phosphomethylpyrimidine kinase